MLVRDLMHEGLLTCPPATSLGQAAASLVLHRVHALIVTDADGTPVGLLSDTDLLAGEWISDDAESLRVMQSMTAGELMSTPVMSIAAESSAAEAAARMKHEHVSRLLVTEADRPVGVIAVSDLVAHIGSAPLRPRTVKDAMSWGIVVCAPDTPIAPAARAMTERRSRSLVVVESSGNAVGVLTGHDLLGIYDSPGLVETVAELMHAPLTIEPEATLREAADLMLKHEVHRLLVVDETGDGAPLGLISTSDIVAEMAEPGSAWRSNA